MSGIQTTSRLVGKRLKRTEDPRFLLGQGNFIDDIVRPGMIFASFVRSSEAHAVVKSVDLSGALALKGVVDAISGSDISGYRALRADSGAPGWQGTAQRALAVDKVRFVGEAIACVVAEDRYLAEDAAYEVDADTEPLAPITSITDALDVANRPLHDGWTDNVYVTRRFETAGFDDVMAAAPRRKSARYEMARHTGMPVETRGCIAEWDPHGTGLTLWSSTQIPHLVRTCLADVLNLPEGQIRVIAPDVGGGFGIKGHFYPEEAVCAILAMRTGRPVKWIEDRREHLISAVHAREHVHEIEVGYDDSGVVQALRGRAYVNCGAYSALPFGAGLDVGMVVEILPGPYRIQNYSVEASGVATNKTPLGPYRAVGRPAACFSIERTMDLIAEDLGIDRVEVRRRNLIRDDEYPHNYVTGATIDSGSHIQALDRALTEANYEKMLEEQRAGREQGRYIGLGVVSYFERTGFTGARPESKRPTSPIVYGFESATVRMDLSGFTNVYVSSHSHGQGHETTLAQVAADELGTELDQIRIRYGDTSHLAYGGGTFGSRTAVLTGGATHRAAKGLAEKLRRTAAHLLAVDPDEVVLAGGRAFPSDSPDKGYTLQELARVVYQRADLLPPDEMQVLECTKTYDSAPGFGTYANTCLVVQVEVDAETGLVKIDRLVCVEDCGQAINPLVVDGQAHGGLAQGIGSALFEELPYDEQGQPLATTFLEYVTPGSTDVPNIEVHHIETLSPTTPLGIKGMGEGGTVGPGPLIASAIEDALRPLTSARITQLPVTPERIRELLARESFE